MSKNKELIESKDNIQSTRIYYSIGEVCKITDLEPYVLRYWETEFPQLRPKKSRGGNRAYREKDIDIIKYIKHLLYEEEYTISGAKKKLSQFLQARDGGEKTTPKNDKLISFLKEELKEILSILKK
ncbi:MAG: MerR family transcriptional regulator [Chitinispirillaceae bacterium]|nr:MerR family transcriptional regulator [Chitinispirillaceae bacterium]